jgi:hypothetical protein
MQEEFLNSLIGIRDWTPQAEQIKALANNGQLEVIRQIAIALTDIRRTPNVSDAIRSSIIDQIQNVTSRTVEIDWGKAAFEISWLRERLEANAWHQHRRYEIIPQLVQFQSLAILMEMFRQHSSQPHFHDRLARLVQELVIRGFDVKNTAASKFWNEHIQSSGHPLAWLPLELMLCEYYLVELLPHFSNQGQSCRLAFVGSEHALQNARAISASSMAQDSIQWIENSLSHHESTNMCAAVNNWRQESNGRIEARCFTADRTMLPGEVTPTELLSLQLECLAETSASQIALARADIQEVLELLFGAAATGAAYNDGIGAAYGRLEAWRSLGALAGADTDATLEEVAMTAKKCAWLTFSAKSSWYCDVAWDLGIVALRADGRTLAILAATDTD